jgi:predicted O-methyltransferase YrrM
MQERLKDVLRPLYVPLMSWYYDTWRAPKRYRYLFEAIQETEARNILEVGVWNGKRALQMIECARESAGDVFYYGYDLFEDLSDSEYASEFSKRPPHEAEVRALLSRTGAQVTLFRGNTLTTLPATVPTLPKMDFIFIDGGHSVKTIQNDWDQCEKLMHERTVVIFDDYWRNRTDGGAKPIVDAIDTNRFTIEILPIIDRFNNADFGKLEISFAKITRK